LLQEPLEGVADNFRRTWDKDKYEKLAKDKDKKGRQYLFTF